MSSLIWDLVPCRPFEQATPLSPQHWSGVLRASLPCPPWPGAQVLASMGTLLPAGRKPLGLQVWGQRLLPLSWYLEGKKGFNLSDRWLSCLKLFDGAPFIALRVRSKLLKWLPKSFLTPSGFCASSTVSLFPGPPCQFSCHSELGSVPSNLLGFPGFLVS